MAGSSVRARALRMDTRDTVAILIEDAEKGAEIVLQGDEDGSHLESVALAAEPIPYGHKVALSDMDVGAPVIKYGEKMGIARKKITVGEHVHVHNVRGLNTEERSVSARG